MSNSAAEALVEPAQKALLLKRARELALTGGEAILSALERLAGLSLDEALQFASRESGMPVQRLTQMEAMTPDFRCSVTRNASSKTASF